MASVVGGGRFKYQNSTELTTVTDGLMPYTQYEFSVKVTQRGRSSPYSMVIFNITQEDRTSSYHNETINLSVLRYGRL